MTKSLTPRVSPVSKKHAPIQKHATYGDNSLVAVDPLPNVTFAVGPKNSSLCGSNKGNKNKHCINQKS